MVPPRCYGKSDAPNFEGFEGGEDPAVPTLFVWDAGKKLTGLVINVTCSAQETEAWSDVSADFWHDVREALRKAHGPGLFVLPQCGAAGDLSPHLQIRKKAEEVMRKRRGLTSRQEVARRIANAVADVLPVAQADINTAPVFRHDVAALDLPEKDPPAPPFYETDPVKPIEFHVIRLGDVAIATNPFEMYLDYGIRIQARSKAVLTFVVNLACQHSGYLPTERGVKGGGYSADKYVVGPEGGNALVEETVRRIDALWK
jgi:hypothetical protein